MKVTIQLFCLLTGTLLYACKKDPTPNPGTNTEPKLIEEGNGWTVASRYSIAFTRSDYDRISTASFQIAGNTMYQDIEIELRQQFDVLITHVYANSNLVSGKTEGYTPKHYSEGVRYYYPEPGSGEFALDMSEPYFMFKNGGSWTQVDRHHLPYTNQGHTISSHYFSPATGLMVCTNPYQTVSVFDIPKRTSTFYTSPLGIYNTIGNGRGAVLLDETYSRNHPGHHRILHASLDFVPNKGNYYQLKVADMCDSITRYSSSSDISNAKTSIVFDTVFIRDLNGQISALTYLNDAPVFGCQDDENAFFWVREQEGYDRSVIFRYNKQSKELIRLKEFSTSSVLGSGSPQLTQFSTLYKIPGKDELLLSVAGGLCFSLNLNTMTLKNLSFTPGTDCHSPAVQVYNGKIYGLVYRNDLYVEEATYRTNLVVRNLE